MAGRGRGKPTMSFNTEQLGLIKGELPAQVLQPPLAYPMLDFHISNSDSTNELSYLVELKREFTEYMRDSVNHVLPDVQKKDIERYSDRYQDTITDNLGCESKYNWSRMPMELAPKHNKTANNLKRKNNRKTVKTKRKKSRIIDDDDNNKQLEQQKNKQTQNNTEKEVKDIKEEEEEEENSEEEMEENEEVDEEMDDGTDYVNNYFDNGEAFDDDDDNLDDGPIY